MTAIDGIGQTSKGKEVRRPKIKEENKQGKKKTNGDRWGRRETDGERQGTARMNI